MADKGSKDDKKGGKKRSLWDTVQIIVLIVGFGITFGSAIVPEIRTVVAAGVDVIVSPITSHMPFYIVVLVIAAIVTFFANFIQKYTMDWELVRRIQEKSRAIQKQYREAQLSGDKKKIERAQQEQMAMMEEQTQMTKMQFMPMGFIMVISGPLFFWAFWWLGNNPALTMVFPFWGVKTLMDSVWIFQYWIIWSFICSFGISNVIRKTFNVGVSM